MSRALPRLAIALTFATLAHAGATPAGAQELLASASALTLAAREAKPPQALLFPVAARETLASTAPTAAPDFSRIRRPAVLPVLYATTALTQVLDAHSTASALNHGAREANPLMQGVSTHSGTLMAVKAGAAIGTVFMAEKMWRRNRAGAIAAVVAMNAVTAVVAAHNYAVAARLR